MSSALPDRLTGTACLSEVELAPTAILRDNQHLTSLAIGAFVFTAATDLPTRLLLIRRSKEEAAFPSRWEVPGGGAEPTDESLLDTVVRELKEETGLEVASISECLGQIEFPGRFGRMWRKYNFLVEVKEGQEVVTDPMEHSEHIWGTKEEVEKVEITTEDHRETILQVFAKIEERRKAR
ncbi:NUDIX hydrolase domain-like protein [Pyronema domesticum]|uniref:Similar to Nucleoside diphosphate-linked moiety X motif 17 acc. no. Q5M8V2 n=1 Tax=Pyronema omphalodes (strain CBS 100304) TaxID=1076935 RepID=U4L731_PYROM|nr:NUDIX hydrolase domain-like protein [Pyronema domesticum]CCX05845.1 Similar to Nucleoside diphosphate-linked moiety X motif 17; acc. no. Q5M8V2 [Pyronema omphalodes CBS 100304]